MANSEWIVVMDTSALLCYFENLGYRMVGGQCRKDVVDKFRNLTDGMEKAVVKESKKELEIFFTHQFPESFPQKLKKLPSGIRKKIHLVCGDSLHGPKSIQRRMQNALENEFITCDKVPAQNFKQIKGDLLQYFKTHYVNDPLGGNSVRYLGRKRHEHVHSGLDDDVSEKDRNRTMLRDQEKRMRNDLDILIHAVVLAESDSGRNVLFLTKDKDHLIFARHLVQKTNQRFFVIEFSSRGYGNIRAVLERP